MLCSRMSWSRGGKYDRLGKPGVESGGILVRLVPDVILGHEKMKIMEEQL